MQDRGRFDAPLLEADAGGYQRIADWTGKPLRSNYLI
jgi:hypothetical protein